MDDRRHEAADSAEVIIDLTESGQWRTASTDVSVLEPDRRRGLGRRPMPRTAPKGEKHAYRLGEATTACGQSVADLHAWDDERFGDGLLNCCPRCLELTRAARSALDRVESRS